MPFTDELFRIALWRRSQQEDVPEILTLFKTPQTRDLFGNVDIHKLIEVANVSLSQKNTQGEIVAHISLCDHPNIPSVPSCSWLHWLKHFYGLEHATVRNTLFIHLLAWHNKYAYIFLTPLLESIFLNNIYLKYIILIVPPGVIPSDILEEYFNRVVPESDSFSCIDFHRLQRLYICLRQRYISKLKMRRAVEEDHDDLVPIFNNITDGLRNAYGDYYLAELISHPTRGRQVIVAEKQMVPIGMACLNGEINLCLLNEYFELAPFYGLHHPNPQDQLPLPEVTHVDSLEVLRMSMPTLDESDMTAKFTYIDPLFEVLSPRLESGETSRQSSESDDYIIIEDQPDNLLMRHFYDDDDDVPPDMVHASEAVTETTVVTPQSMSPAGSISMFLEDKVGHYPLEIPGAKFQALRIPIYYGDQNAFAIDMFAIHEEYDERLAFDFLEAAFECFPKMDFCIITVPSIYPTFPLLDHFVRVTPRPNCCFAHELFVAHRNAVFGDMEVREATCEDQSCVHKLLGCIEYNEIIKLDFMNAVYNKDSSLLAYVIESEKEVIGLAIIVSLNQVDHICANYDVEMYCTSKLYAQDQHALIKHIVMCPVFQMHARFFLREVQRLSDKSALYYKLHGHKLMMNQGSDSSTLITVLAEMVPVKPRKHIEYNFTVLGENVPKKELFSNADSPFALYYMNRRLSTVRKLAVNARIVVVGASNVAISFLETLLYGPTSSYLTFNNITLVSEHGLPGTSCPHNARDTFLLYHGHYNAEHLEKLSFRTWINLVYGVLTSINRNRKFIVINQDRSLHYDYLMLFCGEQFQKPSATSRRNIYADSDKMQCLRHENRYSEDYSILPHNVFLINSEIDASNALTMLKHLIGHQSSYNVIVYGHSMNAFCCIAALQEFDIPNSNITFVESFPTDPHAVSIFNNIEVDDSVMSNLIEEGITIYSHYYFASWEYNPQDYKVTQVVFESKTKAIVLDCLAMFYYGDKCIGDYTLLALSRASLVYDGRLVIDKNFNTNDPYIYAAGPFTKYTRRYYSDHMAHRFFNSVEIGMEVAQKMMEKLEPTWNEERFSPRQPEQLFQAEFMDVLVPVFTKPMVVYCHLPGGIKYLKVSKSGMELPLEAALTQDDYGNVFVTGECKGENIGYFRLHFNKNCCVETITCYARHEIDVHNLIQLYGKHERLLNKLIDRFESRMISNFYEYFQEPWCYALYHDRFQWLQRDTYEIINSCEVGKKSILEEIVATLQRVDLERNFESTAKIQAELEQKYVESRVAKQVMRRTLQYIQQNSDLLSMYAYPQLIQIMLHGYFNSPMFQLPR